MPLFSIITINLNNKIGLQKTIESVFSQTYTDYEYIIIDGASTDGSYEIIHGLSSGTTYCLSEKDNGIYDAMNKGIAVAKGKYCLFLNSGDCLFKETVLEKVATTMKKTNIVYGDVIYSKNGSIVGPKMSPSKISIFYLMAGCIDHQVQFIERSMFDKFGSFSTHYKINSDYEFFVKLYFTSELTTSHLPIPISVFDLSGLSANPENKKLLMAERKKIHKEYFPISLYFLYYSFTQIRDYTSAIPIVGHLFKFINKSAEKLIGVKH